MNNIFPNFKLLDQKPHISCLIYLDCRDKTTYVFIIESARLNVLTFTF